MTLLILATGLFMTLAIGLGRVYLGVHWPTDVLGGWTAGSIWVLGVWLVAHRLDASGNAAVLSRKDE